MLLAEASQISEELRNYYRNYMRDSENRSQYFNKLIDTVSLAVRDSIDDLNQLIDMFFPSYSKYPRQYVSFRDLRDDVCKKLSISPLVWDEALAGKPMVPLLALESPEYGGDGLTVKQGLNLMSRIKDLGFLEIASKINEKEALVFWARATGERPPIPINRFLQIISYVVGENPQTLQSINILLQTMLPAEIAQRMIGTQKPIEVRTMQPGQPFVGPVYKAWDKFTTPTDVFVEVISNSRRYLHITEFPKGNFKGVFYDRHRQLMGKPLSLPIEQEAILEVEVDGLDIKFVTDILSLDKDWDIHKSDYRDRVNKLEQLNLSKPVKSGKFVSNATDFTHMLETIEPTERLRLTNTDGIVAGGQGGWLVMKDAFHIQLLVNAVKRDEEYDTFVRLSALDGYESYEVGQVKLTVSVAQHLRQRLAQQGVLAGQDWLPVDEYGMVVVMEMKEFSLQDLSVTDGEIKYLDDDLGFSDVSQLTDLIEMSD